MPHSDPVKRAEYKRRYYEANRERLRERSRQHYEANRAQKIDYQRQYSKANRERFRDRNRVAGRRLRHGMLPDQWQQMYDDQDGLCYLCADPLPAGRLTVIDHDHDCCPAGFSCRACRRGLACNSCNTLIGLAGDDADRLRRIAANLESAQRAVAARMAQKPVQGTLEEAS